MASPTTTSARLFYRSARERLEDARFLHGSGRQTGAVYLAGYAVECMMKALILEGTPVSRHAAILDSFRGQKAHDLGALRLRFEKRGHAGVPRDVAKHFGTVGTWSTRLRYEPAETPPRKAATFLEAVEAIFRWADGRF